MHLRETIVQRWGLQLTLHGSIKSKTYKSRRKIHVNDERRKKHVNDEKALSRENCIMLMMKKAWSRENCINGVNVDSRCET